MDDYFNDYLNFRTDNYNMMDNSYSDNNRRMTDREVDAYYEDYMKRDKIGIRITLGVLLLLKVVLILIWLIAQTTTHITV